MNDAELRLLLGKRVNYLRRLADLTQSQLAEKANLSVNYVSEIETGIASPTLKTLLKLSQELNVEMRDLFDFRQLATSKNTTRKRRKQIDDSQ